VVYLALMIFTAGLYNISCCVVIYCCALCIGYPAFRTGKNPPKLEDFPPAYFGDLPHILVVYFNPLPYIVLNCTCFNVQEAQWVLLTKRSAARGHSSWPMRTCDVRNIYCCVLCLEYLALRIYCFNFDLLFICPGCSM
jgi:hypothetical protein